jgi:hypothetical protein
MTGKVPRCHRCGDYIHPAAHNCFLSRASLGTLGATDYLLLALWFLAIAAAAWLLFSSVVLADECQPGYAIGFGSLTADSTGGGFAVGQGLWIVPKPETAAEYRLRELEGRGVEVIIRVVR